ncbi:MAG: hypothetical protein WBE50_15955, partial [Methyloceanibacter sp.]
ARRIRYVTVKGTRRDAESELARLLHEANTGVAVDPSKILVRDYLRSWLEGMHGLTDRAHTAPEASTGSRQGYDGCHPRAWRITVCSPNFEGCIAVSG